MGSPSVVVDIPALRAGTFHEVFFSIWREPGQVSDVRALSAAQRAFAQRLGGDRMILFSVIQARAVVTITADVRRAVEENTREIQERVKASAVVIVASGFAAAAMRSVIAALMLLNRPKYPTQVFENEDGACSFAATHLTPELGKPGSAADVLAAYHAVRDQAPMSRR